MFVRIYEQGTSKGFTQDTNENWEAETRPILEAFWHAKYFLEQAIRYGKVIDGPEYMLPSGWAALLYLYNKRWRPSRYRLGMSELHVPVVRIGKVGKHPNADTLSITQAGGFPVIFRTGDFKEGDLAIYVPIDSLLPLDNPLFRFLAKAEPTPGSYHRLKALRLRGIFSRGLLAPASDPRTAKGTPIVGRRIWPTCYGIKKYEPELPVSMNTEQLPDPGFAPSTASSTTSGSRTSSDRPTRSSSPKRFTAATPASATGRTSSGSARTTAGASVTSGTSGGR
jgi:hypothetical protein